MKGRSVTHRYRVGIDVGGTFTDFIVADEHSGSVAVLKTSSVRSHPSAAIFSGLSELSDAGKVDVSETHRFVHGTTLALNTILERNGARVGLIITEGFRDVLEIRRLRLDNPHNIYAEKPVPLIPRMDIAEVPERVKADGTVEIPLNPDDVLAAAGHLVEQGVQAIVVSLLHSYRNHQHEQQACELITAAFPEMYVCSSHEIWPQQREYERTLLSVMNAYVGRRMRDYFLSLTSELAELGLPGPAYSTQSNGGILTASSAAEMPVVTLLSGPAAGVMGAIYVGAQAGIDQLITLDMGGTSADVAIVEGTPHYSTENRVGDFPVIMPAIDVSSIGAGGGSIAWTDHVGVLKVGPQSAGADPGPACYGRGGTQPTVTDAYVMLGIIDPEQFLGGTMRLDVEAAERAIAALGERIGLSPLEAAAAIIDVATSNMEAQFLPLMAQQGVDPSQFTLVPYGGAGPTHAFMFARQVGIPQVLVPPIPGVLSAIGCLVADLRSDYVSSVNLSLAEIDSAELAGIYADLATKATAWLEEQQADVVSTSMVYSADMRYLGQSFEIPVMLPDVNGNLRLEDVEREFHEQYEKIYHYNDPNSPVEMINCRVQIIGETSSARINFHQDSSVAADTVSGSRRVWFNDAYVDATVYVRANLKAEQTLSGPFIVEQYDTTIFVPPGFEVYVDSFGNLIGRA